MAKRCFDISRCRYIAWGTGLVLIDAEWELRIGVCEAGMSSKDTHTKLATKHTCGLVVFRTKIFFSPFSPFFCSSNRRHMQPTLLGSASAAVRVRVWFPAVVHWTSASVKVYALLNRFL